MIVFPRVQTIFVHNAYMFVSHICIVYVVKEVASIHWVGHLMGGAHNRMCAT